MKKANKMSASVLTRIYLISLGITFYCVECIHLGLISPIEVVEEFGCHDSELRLTCSNLDSKLAILEATFSPNCTHDECLRLDLKRLVRTFASEEIEESKNAEKEAGQKFLETLRQSQSKDEEEINVEIVEDGNLRDGKSSTSAQNKNRTSLRLVLERLIIHYLRKMSPEEELEGGRFSRSLHDVSPESNHAYKILLNISTPAVSFLNETTEAVETSENENVIRTQSTRSQCEEYGRQISSLNRLDLENSYKNQSDNEYNIRRVVNKRCSGKNHCSFIFAIDHPFAKVWEGGVVRIKYICMEDFRMNRYCGEHLSLGYEIDPIIQVLDGGDPKAEARLQPRETALHSLKIIKAVKTNAAGNLSNMSTNGFRKLKMSELVKQEETTAEGRNSGVYSQDFRVLKILPSNLDDFNDMETIGNEIYFKKEEISKQRMTVNETNSNSSNNSNAEVAPKNEINVLDEILNNKTQNNTNSLENITLTIREGAQYVMIYQKANDTPHTVPSNLEGNEINFENVSTPDKNSLDSELSKQDGTKSSLPVLPSATYHSTQRTLYRSPLLHGFAMTPGYPKFYIGGFDCHWDILAPEGIRIWVTIIDNSLRIDETCKDFLQIDDVGTNTTLFNSCTEATQPIGVLSSSNWMKVTVKTTSVFAFPKRGVLLHYTADSCLNPPLPSHVKLVERTAVTAFYECMPSFVFSDSGLTTRKLTCNILINVWDKLLPDCTEQENLTGSEEKLTSISKRPDLSVVKKMTSHNDADMITDIIIPSVLIAGLFIINGAIFAVIMRYRKRNKDLGDKGVELAEL